jgi:hypothetical protein
METEYGFNEEAMIGIPDARKALELMKSLPDGLWPGREDK